MKFELCQEGLEEVNEKYEAKDVCLLPDGHKGPHQGLNFVWTPQIILTPKQWEALKISGIEVQ